MSEKNVADFSHYEVLKWFDSIHGGRVVRA